MNEIAPVLWAQVWQVTAVAAVVFVAVKAFANNRPHLAHVLWALVLIKCITPPLFSSHISPFSWLAAEVNSVHVESSTLGDFTSEIQLDTESDNHISVNAPGFRLSRKRGDALANSISGAVPVPAFKKASIVNWKGVLIVVWLVGATMCLLWQGCRLMSLSMLVKRKQQQASPEIESLVAELSSRLGLKRNVKPLITSAPIGPAVIGLFRPMILLPLSIVDRGPAIELEPLIAHELIHVRRGDLWWALLQTAAGALFWFHPLIRLTVVGISRESERCCDEETVTSLGCSPADYARCLLNVLEQKHRLRSAPALPGVKPIEITSARLERVMKLGHGSYKRTPWWTWVVLVTCCALVLPGAALVFAQETSEGPSTMEIGSLAPLLEGVTTEKLTEETAVGLIYRVDDIVEEMRKKHPEAEIQELELRLLRHLKEYPFSDRASSDNSKTQRRVTKIRDGKLSAMRTAADHDKLRNRIKQIRRLGLRQIVIETRVVTSPAGTFADLSWEESAGDSFLGKRGTVHRKKAINGPVVLASYDSANPDLTSQVVSTGEFFSDFESEHDNDHELRDVEQSPRLVRKTILDAGEVKALLNRVAQDENSFVTQAPKVVMFDGQNASIDDYSQRPFVTGVDVIKDGNGKTANQPLISILSDGTCVDLSVESTGDREVQIDADVMFSTIEHVGTYTFNDTPSVPLTIQLPKVAASRLQFDGTIGEEKTLVIRTTNPNDSTEDILFMMSPRLIEDVQVSKTEEEEPYPPTYYISDGIQYFPKDGQEVANATAAMLEVSLVDRKNLKRRFDKLCFENRVDASEDEIDQHIEDRASELGLSSQRFVDLIVRNRELNTTQLREIISNEIRYGKLPENIQRRIQGSRLGIAVDANVDGIIIRAQDDNRNWEVDNAKILKVGGGRVIVRTDVEMSATQDGIEFMGNGLELVTANGEPYASADELRLIMSGENVTISLKGNAQLTVGTTIIADSIQYDNRSNKLLAVGKASMTGDGVSISADRIDSVVHKLILKGDAEFKSTTDESQEFQGQKIEFGENGSVTVDGVDQGEFGF